jgi:hypothetical protein
LAEGSGRCQKKGRYLVPGGVFCGFRGDDGCVVCVFVRILRKASAIYVGNDSAKILSVLSGFQNDITVNCEIKGVMKNG